MNAFITSTPTTRPSAQRRSTYSPAGDASGWMSLSVAEPAWPTTRESFGRERSRQPAAPAINAAHTVRRLSNLLLLLVVIFSNLQDPQDQLRRRTIGLGPKFD